MSLAGIDVTKSQAAGEFPEYNLGERGSFSTRANGYREFVYVQAQGALTTGQGVIIQENWDAGNATATRANGFNYGAAVVMADVVDNGYVWVQIYGRVTLSGGGFSAGNAVTANNGFAASGGADLEGISVKASAGGNTEAFLTYPRTARG